MLSNFETPCHSCQRVRHFKTEIPFRSHVLICLCFIKYSIYLHQDVVLVGESLCDITEGDKSEWPLQHTFL